MENDYMKELFENLAYQFIVDYKDQCGKDLHNVVTVACAPDKHVAARGVYESIKREGFIPQGILYIPGFRSADDLYHISEDFDAARQVKNAEVMYVSREMLNSVGFPG